MVRWILIAAGLLVILLGCGIGFRVHDDVVDPGPDGNAARTRPLPGCSPTPL